MTDLKNLRRLRDEASTSLETLIAFWDSLGPEDYEKLHKWHVRNMIRGPEHEEHKPMMCQVEIGMIFRNKKGTPMKVIRRIASGHYKGLYEIQNLVNNLKGVKSADKICEEMG